MDHQPPPMPDGCYPRLNAAMMQTGKFNSMIVSMVGKFGGDGGGNAADGGFVCCDQGRIHLNADQGSIPDNLPAGMVVEIMGQVVDSQTLSIFISRELSVDMDLDVYNKMLQVQHSPKFRHCFVPQGAQMPTVQ